ncbi:MAG: phosphoribosylanthranilate isomerase, partial [Oscillospiraceae bacterium]|nr:phosphoribosylanthranilate isomerase [Oscillospiraceae bacterium]
MTRIKLCGLTRPCDIEAANALLPEYIGFVFAEKSRRRVTDQEAKALRAGLDPAVQAVGVFVREQPERVAALLNEGVIDLAQLHGGEDESYLARMRELTDRPLIQAFRVETEEDLRRAAASTADYILLDHGVGGTGEAFDWSLLRGFERPY